MVTIFRRSNGILYLEFLQYGKKVQRSIKLQDTPSNRAFLKREVIPPLVQKILMGEFDKEKPKNFKYYSDIYLQDKQYLKDIKRLKHRLEHINTYFESMQIDKIYRGNINDFVRELLQTKTPKTVRNYLSSLRGVFDIALDKQAIKINPALDIHLPSHKPQQVEPFTPIEVNVLIQNATGGL